MSLINLEQATADLKSNTFPTKQFLVSNYFDIISLLGSYRAVGYLHLVFIYYS